MDHLKKKKKMSRLPLVSAAVAATLVVVKPGPVQAQDLTYTTVTKAEFGGAMGRMMKLVPGADTDVRETVWISGPRMRTDTEGWSTITDWEGRRWLSLDHQARTYTEIDMSDWETGMEQVSQAVQANAEQAGAESGARRGEVGGDAATHRLEIDLSTERTGDKRTISGFDAERVFVTLEMRAENLEVADDPEHPEMKEGVMVLLTELWLTDENLMAVPDELDMDDYREMTAGAMESWAAMEQVYANDPELQVAFDRSRAALDDLQGTAIESTLFWVIVPPDKDFDREAALADRDRSLADDVAAAAAESAKESAKESVKKGLGRLGGGLFGGKKEEEKEPEPEEEPELVQQTFMRIKTLLESVERSSIPADRFQVPEGYTRVELGATGAAGGI